jgi:fimbrial chaperone protein
VILAKGESAATVTVTNSGTAPVTAQLRLFAWDQQQNEDKLDPTSALVASPPMLQIPPGSSQTIRVVRVLTTPPTSEESYRLIVDEIPDRTVRDAGTGVVVQLRYSVPVFVLPKPNDKANAVVKATLSGDALLLDVANRGKVHAQISNITLAYANGSTTTVGAGLVGYVLPAKQRQWKLDLPKEADRPGKPTRVRATVNGKELLVAL